MPASMISPDTGSRWKVSGKSIAMVAIGQMPGSTPNKVPISAPMSAKPRLAGVSATENPVARLARSCSMLPLRPHRDRQRESEHEDHPSQYAQAGGGGERLPEFQLAPGSACDQHQ